MKILAIGGPVDGTFFDIPDSVCSFKVRDNDITRYDITKFVTPFGKLRYMAIPAGFSRTHAVAVYLDTFAGPGL